VIFFVFYFFVVEYLISSMDVHLNINCAL